MPNYKAPLDEIRFILNEVLDIQGLSKEIPSYENADFNTINMILEAVGTYAEEVAAPLNETGDKQGCSYDMNDKTVTTPDGFKEAFNTFKDMGMMGLNGSPDYGGMDLPFILSAALNEMMTGSNTSLSMYPGLTTGAATVLEEFANEDIKKTFLTKMYDGSWTGTMCLTEPEAGTDLGLVKSKADMDDDGNYKVSGTKIFISCGEQDLSENIAHLVLARTPDAPKGTKGISLFLVPKYIPDENGDVGEQNTLSCTGLWSKMGVHGSSTTTIQFDNAKGYLIGQENQGLKHMFEMMNDARLKVGMQGLGLSESAFQKAAQYASERVQGSPITNQKAPATEIINHSNIRRDLIDMKSQIDGYRALLYEVAVSLDVAHNHPEDVVRSNAKEYASLMTPIVKACTTDFSLEATQKGIQLHGGSGYIREVGAEQLYRDALIGTIWEGTNDVQSMDFTFRKAMDPKDLGYKLGLFMNPLIEEIEFAKNNEALSSYAQTLEDAMKTFQSTATSLLQQGMSGQIDDILVHSNDFTNMFGKLAVGRMWLKMIESAQEKISQSNNGDSAEFYKTKIELGHHYLNRIMLPEVKRLEMVIDAGASTVRNITSKQIVPKSELGIASHEHSKDNGGKRFNFSP